MTAQHPQVPDIDFPNWPPPEISINGLFLKLTCGACPEQYDVYDGLQQVGYLRLRHGEFEARLTNSSAELTEVVYEAFPNGDGQFENDERKHFLTQAVEAIKEARVFEGQFRATVLGVLDQIEQDAARQVIGATDGPAWQAAIRKAREGMEA